MPAPMIELWAEDTVERTFVRPRVALRNVYDEAAEALKLKLLGNTLRMQDPASFLRCN